MVGGDTAPRDNAMDMRVMVEVLSPSMEDSEHAHPRAKVLRISRGDPDRLRSRFEKNAVDDSFVVERDLGDLGREGEDDVEIRDRQELFLAISEPLSPGQSLTLRTVTVAARVVGMTDMATVGAMLGVAAKHCGSASFDRRHDAAFNPAKMTVVLMTVLGAVTVKDIRHLDERAQNEASRRRYDLYVEPIERADRPADDIGGDLRVERCGHQAPVAEERLDDADVRP